MNPLAAHFLIVINHSGEHHADDLVGEFRAFGDDFHRIPFVFFEVRLNLLGSQPCFTVLKPSGAKVATGGGHQMACLFLGCSLASSE